MIIDTIMFFAAGLGSRMRHLTDSTPKSLLTIWGKPILYHSLDLCKSHPFKRIVINTHYLPEKIEQKLTEYRVLNPAFPEIITIYEPQLLETGGAIKNAIKILGQKPIFALNTDVLIKSDNNHFMQLQNAWNPVSMDFMLLVQPYDKAIGYKGCGDFEIDNTGQLSRPKTKKNYSYMYAGLQILDPMKVASNKLNIFSLQQYFLKSNRVFGTIANDTKWFHASTPEDIADIESNMSAISSNKLSSFFT